MYSEARKINLLENVLKVTDETTLIKLETVLKKSKTTTTKIEKKPSIYDFVGILTKKESDGMKKAIEETGEQINPDDWK